MKVYSENITHKIPYTPTKKPSTPTKIPSRQTKTRSTINKTLIRPRKSQLHQQNIEYNNQNTKYANQNTKHANQKFMLFCREAFFVTNLSTFLAYFLEAKKYGGVPKRTNIRYGSRFTRLVVRLFGWSSPCQKYLKNPYNAIFLKSQGSKDIKNDILNCQIHKYTNTNSQIHKYSI